jgi:hypothetical protein
MQDNVDSLGQVLSLCAEECVKCPLSHLARARLPALTVPGEAQWGSGDWVHALVLSNKMPCIIPWCSRCNF